MYVLQWPNGDFVRHRGWRGSIPKYATSSLHEARVFLRKSDATQSYPAMRGYSFWEGDGSDKRTIKAIPVKVYLNLGAY